jgi:hypothetical protein
MNSRFPSRRSSSLAGGTAVGWSSLQVNIHLPYGQVDSKPSFTERIKALEAAAETVVH